MNYLKDLNKEQLDAVKNVDSPTRIIAGPGTGKTKTLISKVLYLLDNNLANVNEIVVFTFTNKAANELEERLKIHFEGKRMPEISTYHKWAAKLLRIQYKALGKNSDFRILDSTDSKSIVDDIIDSEGLDVDSKEAIPLFSNFNYNQQTKKDKEGYEAIIFELYEKYIQRKRDLEVKDFDDLLVDLNSLLKEHPEICEFYKTKYKYIMIDEFQDTNNIQYEIIKKITNKNSLLTVVGDPDQNIYSWRGANIHIILNFSKDYENVKTIVLVQNYRSTEPILRIANSIIKHNKDRIVVDLVATKNASTEVNTIETSSTAEEAEVIIAKVINLVRNNICKLHEVAIIFRNNYLSRDFESVLISNKIPYKLIGGFKFFDRKEVKEVLNFLHFLLKGDDFCFSKIINVPIRGMGPSSVKKLIDAAKSTNQTVWNYLSENKKSYSKLESFITEIEKCKKVISADTDIAKPLMSFLKGIGYIEFYSQTEDKIKNIEGIIEVISKDFKRLEGSENEKITAFFQNISLSSSSDLSTEQDHITLLTSHASKGTEYEVVFVVGLNQGVLPSWRALEKDDLEEERRLFYVSCTRAKTRLYLSYPLGIDFRGKEREKSQFVYEALSSSKDKLDDNTSMSTNNIDVSHGDVVFHNIWGEGVIVEDDSEIITVAFKKSIGLKKIIKGHNSYIKK